jgi:hypothetical protein
VTAAPPYAELIKETNVVAIFPDYVLVLTYSRTMEPIKKQLEEKTYIHLGSEGEFRPSTSTKTGDAPKLMKRAASEAKFYNDMDDMGTWNGSQPDSVEHRVPGKDWRDTVFPSGRKKLAGDLGLPNEKKTGKTSNPKRFYNPYSAPSPRNPYNRT